MCLSGTEVGCAQPNEQPAGTSLLTACWLQVLSPTGYEIKDTDFSGKMSPVSNVITERWNGEVLVKATRT